MSSQLEFLNDLIASAQTGNEGAITLLRQICVLAAERAPVYDLVAIGQCLCHLGIEASRSQTDGN